MKYLKLYESFDKKDMSFYTNICNKYSINNYIVNDDGSINVDGNVNFYQTKQSELPLNFGEVTGDFYCSYNKLTSLEGSPASVGGGFYCSYNKLTSLEGCPVSVGEHFDCSDNKITSLKGCPDKIHHNLMCCNNKITSFEGCPKYLSGYFYCDGNPIYHIWKLFTDYNKVELFNDYDIIRENSKVDLSLSKKLGYKPPIIVIDRLNDFLEEVGQPVVEEFVLNQLKNNCGYKII